MVDDELGAPRRDQCSPREPDYLLSGNITRGEPVTKLHDESRG